MMANGLIELGNAQNLVLLECPLNPSQSLGIFCVLPEYFQLFFICLNHLSQSDVNLSSGCGYSICIAPSPDLEVKD